MENEWIIGSVSMLDEHDKPLSVVCAIASPIVRKRIVNQLSKNEFLIFPTLVDPSAILGDSCDVDNGCIICATSLLRLMQLLVDMCILIEIVTLVIMRLLESFRLYILQWFYLGIHL